jgi:hypothetical protein
MEDAKQIRRVAITAALDAAIEQYGEDYDNVFAAIARAVPDATVQDLRDAAETSAKEAAQEQDTALRAWRPNRTPS